MFAHAAALAVMMTFGAPETSTTAKPDDVLIAARLEKMLADGDKDMILEVFRRCDDGALQFIDTYLEGGLKLIEEGKGEEAGLASFRKGVAFAKLADEAMPGATFTQYAASFASWSPKERKLFREGQAEYRAGSKAKSNPAEALVHYQESWRIARSLNDSWGAEMALMGMTRMELALGNHAKVETTSSWAQQAAAVLRLRLDQVDAIVAMGDAQAALAERGHGAPAYQHAFSLLRADDDPQLRRMVLERQCKALERAGSPDAAAALRKQNADLLATPEPPPPPATPPAKTPG